MYTVMVYNRLNLHLCTCFSSFHLLYLLWIWKVWPCGFTWYFCIKLRLIKKIKLELSVVLIVLFFFSFFCHTPFCHFPCCWPFCCAFSWSLLLRFPFTSFLSAVSFLSQWALLFCPVSLPGFPQPEFPAGCFWWRSLAVPDPFCKLP